MAGSLLVAIGSYVIMLVAYYMNHWRRFHMATMVSVIIIDLFFPLYLVMNRDWYRRLIDQEEIFSFMIWMHFMLVLTLYALYGLQVWAARRMLQGDSGAREEHRIQGKGILIARGLTIISAALLIEPGEQG